MIKLEDNIQKDIAIFICLLQLNCDRECYEEPASSEEGLYVQLQQQKLKTIRRQDIEYAMHEVN